MIQSIVSSPRTIWFAKQNGVHGFTETGRAVNLTPWMERVFNATNGLQTEFWSDGDQAFAFYAHVNGLAAVSVNGSLQETARFVQFGAKMPNETPIWGRPRALAPYVDGLFVAYYDGSTSYVMRLIIEKDGNYRWSGSECTIAGEEITWMRVSSPGGNPRLWIATSVGGVPKLYYQTLPISGNPWTEFLRRSGLEPRAVLGSGMEGTVVELRAGART